MSETEENIELSSFTDIPTQEKNATAEKSKIVSELKELLPIEMPNFSEFDMPIQKNKEIKKPEWDGENNVLGTTFNLVATVVGAGIVSFPYAFKSTGIVSGLILCLFFSFISVVSLRMLFMAIHSAPRKVNCYEDLSLVYFGPIVKRINEAVMLFTVSGTLITFLCIIADSVSPIMGVLLHDEHFFASHEFIICTWGIVVVYPLTLLRQLTHLKWTSVGAVLAVSYVIFLIPITAVVHLFMGNFDKSLNSKIIINTDRYLQVMPEFIMALPIFAFAFSCHYSAVPIHNELKDVSLPKLDIVSISTFGFIQFGYAAVGLCGYLYFAQETQPDVLLNYGATSIEASIGRCLLAVCLTFHYPLIAAIQRQSVYSIFAPKSDAKDIGTWGHVITTSFLFILNMTLAVVMPDLTVIFGFCSSVGITLICFGFPSLFGFRVARRMKGFGKVFYYTMSGFLMGMSIFIIVVGPMIIQDIEDGDYDLFPDYHDKP